MLKRNMIMKTLIAVLAQFILCATTLGGLITMTDAEQQVVAEIGYMSGGVNYTVEKQLVPDPPQGLSNANLSISFAHYGVSVSESLASVFLEDQLTANGSAFASAEWGSQPLGAQDVHGGGGSIFILYFTRDSSPAYFYVNGQIDIDMEDYLSLHPEEVFVYVRLSSDDGSGMTTIWEDASDGTGGDTSIAIDHGVWLEAGQTYLLEAYAESGTVASIDYPGLKSRTASFSFFATIDEGQGVEAAIEIDPDTLNLNSKGKWITCHIELPEGYDVEDIDVSTIKLNDQVPAESHPTGVGDCDNDGVTDLMVKFNRAAVQQILQAGDEVEITVTGELNGETFEGSDTIRVIDKGGKK